MWFMCFQVMGQSMKRNQLQHVSLDDRRRRTLMMQLIKRTHDKPIETIAWIDSLSDDDKITLFVGATIGIKEMVLSVTNLANCILPIIGMSVRDIELRNRGKEVDDDDIT